ncbi:outer membrane receptor protein involved in Fe transport [Sphingomonas trueperi]|uniref:hypothetical protein n=1 Tax=Sphingomonas trueperi TaxID=53317 RepID=UPI003398A897
MSSFLRRAATAQASTVVLALALTSASQAAAAAPDPDRPATAAAPDPDKDEGLDQSGGEIIVTAQRREQRLQDVPGAVTALSATLFRGGGVGRSANEVLDLVPNASAGTQQHGRPRWWIRGVCAG